MKPGPPTKNKSIRLRVEVWSRVESKAKKRGITVNAAVAEAVIKWLGAQAPPPPKSRHPEPNEAERAAIDRILGRTSADAAAQAGAETAASQSAAFEVELAKVMRADQPGAGALVSTPPGAKMSAPRKTVSWDWAKPEKKGKP